MTEQTAADKHNLPRGRLKVRSKALDELQAAGSLFLSYQSTVHVVHVVETVRLLCRNDGAVRQNGTQECHIVMTTVTARIRAVATPEQKQDTSHVLDHQCQGIVVPTNSFESRDFCRVRIWSDLYVVPFRWHQNASTPIQHRPCYFWVLCCQAS